MPESGFGEFAMEVRALRSLTIRSDAVNWTEEYVRPERTVDLVLYLGCNILRTAHLAAEAVDLFQSLGFDVQAVAGPQFCCGVIHEREGNAETAIALARATRQKLTSYGASRVAMWCPTCYLRYEELEGKGAIDEMAMVSAVQLLAQYLDRLPIAASVPVKAALHTHTGTAQRAADAEAATRLLQAVPGVEITGTISSDELDYHCPTGLGRMGRQRFREVRDDLVRQSQSLGADTIVTVYHSCHRLWSDVPEAGMPVRNYASILAEAVGRARTDTFQQYVGERDAGRIVELARRNWESHRMDSETARKLAASQFEGERDVK